MCSYRTFTCVAVSTCFVVLYMCARVVLVLSFRTEGKELCSDDVLLKQQQTLYPYLT